jgi:hypothetical protein
MMRLLLTILAVLGFAWAFSSARADDTVAVTPPAVTDTAQPGPRQFGARSGDSRIVIEAKEETWVRVSDTQGALVFMRTMKGGESYRVPDRAGLVLDTGNAKGLMLKVDGKPVPAAVGMVRRGIALDADALAAGATQTAAVEPVRKAEPARDRAPVKNVEPASEPAPETKTVEVPALPAEEPKKESPVVAAEPAANAQTEVAQAPEPAKPAIVAPVAAPVSAKDPEPPVPSREALTAPPVLAEAKSEVVEPVNAVAEPAPQRAQPAQPEKAEIAPQAPKPGPRHFAANRQDARIVIEAKEAAWLRINDAEGKLVFMRNMQPGETYRVPTRTGLTLDTGNA